MSIVIMVGGTSTDANPEHRYLVQQFIEHFGDQVTGIITTNPVRYSVKQKIQRQIKRGQYIERIRRFLYNRQAEAPLANLEQHLFIDNAPTTVPGGSRVHTVSGHNAPDCIDLLKQLAPDVIVVYGTAIIREQVVEQARIITLNMHTGLSPWYRGDSTLFWPVYYNQAEKLGVTVHELTSTVDGGDIAYTGLVKYSPGDDEAAIFGRGVRTGTELYKKAVQQALDGTLTLHAQDLNLGREFRWIHRTVAAEKKVIATLKDWAETAP